MATHRVLVTHEGETNLKVAGAGLLAALLGLFLIQASAGFGALIILGGIVAIAYGLKKRTAACPHCRTQISPRANVCPQCHTSLRANTP